MVRPSSVSGVVLDMDSEKLLDVVLPLIKVSRTVTYKGKKIESRQDELGEIMFLGDLHIGHGSHSGNPLRSHLRFLLDHPHIRIGLMGDYFEYAVMTNFVKNETIDIDEQINEFIRLMKPLKDRIVFALWGNHEERYAKATKSNRLLKSIMDEIGVPETCYVGDPERGVFLSVSAGGQKYGVYALHGRSGATVNKFYQPTKMANNNRVSLIAMGHTHQLGIQPLTEKSMDVIGDDTWMVTRRRYLVNTGCFLKEPGYGEARSYPYSIIGAPIVRFYASRDKIDETDLSLDYRDYLVKGGVVFGDFSYNLDPVKFWENSGKKQMFGDKVKKRVLEKWK
jgi:predicted phosphodiesterase